MVHPAVSLVLLGSRRAAAPPEVRHTARGRHIPPSIQPALWSHWNPGALIDSRIPLESYFRLRLWVPEWVLLLCILSPYLLGRQTWRQCPLNIAWIHKVVNDYAITFQRSEGNRIHDSSTFTDFSHPFMLFLKIEPGQSQSKWNGAHLNWCEHHHMNLHLSRVERLFFWGLMFSTKMLNVLSNKEVEHCSSSERQVPWVMRSNSGTVQSWSHRCPLTGVLGLRAGFHISEHPRLWNGGPRVPLTCEGGESVSPKLKKKKKAL